MKRPLILSSLLVASLATGLAADKDVPGAHAPESGLPASLDALYPPRSDGPVWLLNMMETAWALDGIVGDLLEGDSEGAAANYERFVAQYEKVSGMVPEWSERFPDAPVEALGAAVRSGDRGAVFAAVDAVGAVCHDCHVENMAPAHFRYSWPRFDDLTATDPVTGEDLELPRYMQSLSVAFTGIANNLQQGQPENAEKSFQAFRARMVGMVELCVYCHDSERRYFVDADVHGLVGELGEALKRGDAAAVRSTSERIGMESCRKCHLVHVPGAYGGR